MPSSPMPSDLFQQDVEIEGRAAPEILGMALEEGLRRTAALIAQHAEKIPFGDERGRSAKLRRHFGRDTVDTHPSPLRAL